MMLQMEFTGLLYWGNQPQCHPAAHSEVHINLYMFSNRLLFYIILYPPTLSYIILYYPVSSWGGSPPVVLVSTFLVGGLTSPVRDGFVELEGGVTPPLKQQ